MSQSDLSRAAPDIDCSLMVRGAFDASMDHPNGITAVGGYIGSVEEWNRVEERWANLLALHGMSRFRLTDVFQRLTFDAAVQRAMEFAKIIGDSKLRFVCAHMRDTDWSSLDKDSAYNHLYPQRQHACMSMMLDVLGQELELEFKGKPAAIVFDNDYGNIERAGRIYEACRSDSKFPEPGAIAFTKGSFEWETVPLQCADLLAGVIRRDPLSKVELEAVFNRPIRMDHPLSQLAFTARGKGGRGAMWSSALAEKLSEALRKVKLSEAG